ncbi:MAG: methylated-DNA--[Akkermansia sp.]|nr:methylated-DNA--[protein]-cysteine S-methyltransferase [Akkermansia sp.]
MLTSKQLSIGRIALNTEGGLITRLFLPGEAPPAPPPAAGTLPDLAFTQLEEYLAGTRKHFQLPLATPQGTPLQQDIMQRICTIPYGHTATYGSMGPARVVGSVCAGNPLPILRPCHRVLAAQHPPGHYRGGKALKHLLLTLETGQRHLMPFPG